MTAFLAALQALMREHGITELAATNDGTVCFETADGYDHDFWDIKPDEEPQAVEPEYLMPTPGRRKLSRKS